MKMTETEKDLMRDMLHNEKRQEQMETAYSESHYTPNLFNPYDYMSTHEIEEHYGVDFRDRKKK